jgi:hypothetical protein
MTDDATIIEGDPGFLGMASRLNPVNLPPGLCQLVENMRLDRGVAQTRRGALRVATGIALEAAELTVPFQLALDQPIADLTYATGTITATLTAHGYTTGDTINIRGADQPEYNGDFTITVVDANEFTYTPTGSPAVTPATGTLIANAGPLVQTTYSGGIFAAGVYSSPRFDQAKEYIVLCAPGAAFLWREGETLRTISYPATDTFQPGDDITVLQAFDKLYLHRDRPATTRRVTAIAVSGTTATASVNAHGLTTGDVVRISNADQLALNGDFAVTVTDPNEFDYTVPTGTPAATITEPVFARPVLPTLVWEGDIAVPTFARVTLGVHPNGPTFSRMPAGPIAAYFNNQTAIVRGRDEVLISDVLDAETYDPLLKSFRANVGSNDELVAIHPYAESQALVFGKKSIYLASIAIANDGISIDPAASSLQLLTNEIGCLARRTVATAGVFVFFLSESGVYRLDNQFDLKLRGNTQPLSDPIADLLDDLNQPFAHTSIGLFFGNRYYLAIPTGTSRRAQHHPRLQHAQPAVGIPRHLRLQASATSSSATTPANAASSPPTATAASSFSTKPTPASTAPKPPPRPTTKAAASSPADSPGAPSTPSASSASNPASSSPPAPASPSTPSRPTTTPPSRSPPSQTPKPPRKTTPSKPP